MDGRETGTPFGLAGCSFHADAADHGTELPVAFFLWHEVSQVPPERDVGRAGRGRRPCGEEQYDDGTPTSTPTPTPFPTPSGLAVAEHGPAPAAPVAVGAIVANRARSGRT